MEEEGTEEGWEEGEEPVLDFLVLPMAEARSAEGGVRARQRKAHRTSFDRLDLEMDLAPDISAHAQAKHSPVVQRLRPTSMLSVSSFATFVTADEGESSDEDGGGTIRSIATGRADATMDSKLSGATNAGLAPMRLRDPSFDPPHTLTNGTAVLLSFLGASTAPSSSSTGSGGTPSGFNLTARRLSPQEVEQLRERGEIEVAQVEVEQEQLAATTEQDYQGWWSWLFGAGGGKQGVETEVEQEGGSSSASSWFAWLASAFIPQASSSIHNAAVRRSRTSSRTAAGETTSRLSVFYIDEAGRGGQAFVVARGEQGR
ncbi:hypothetical protein JCM10049v2_005556 [Rhodotorula toruloides]